MCVVLVSSITNWTHCALSMHIMRLPLMHVPLTIIIIEGSTVPCWTLILIIKMDTFNEFNSISNFLCCGENLFSLTLKHRTTFDYINETTNDASVDLDSSMS